MAVVRSGDGRFIETPGGNFGRAVATASRGATEVSVIRQRQLPGGVNPSHTHDREEVMVLLAGEVTVAVAGEDVVLGAGDAVIIPPGTPHRVENRSVEAAEWLLVAPAAVGFFHEDGRPGSPPWSR